MNLERSRCHIKQVSLKESLHEMATKKAKRSFNFDMTKEIEVELIRQMENEPNLLFSTVIQFIDTNGKPCVVKIGSRELGIDAWDNFRDFLKTLNSDDSARLIKDALIEFESNWNRRHGDMLLKKCGVFGIWRISWE